MTIQFDLGAFDLSVRCGAQIDWLEETNNPEVLLLRKQFEDNIEALAQQYQTFFSNGLRTAIAKHKMYFELPDLKIQSAVDTKGLFDDGH